MNEQDTQTVERVAKTINGPHDSSHIGIEELHKMQEYRWKRQTTNAERAQCLNQARAAISAMPDTMAQAATVTPQQAAKVLLDFLATPSEFSPIPQNTLEGIWQATFRESGFVAVRGFLNSIAGGPHDL